MGPQNDIPRLAPRAPESHKGNYGRAMLIGSSRGMTGAMVLSGSATLHSGAGLVTLAVPDVCLETVAAQEPCFMTIPLPCDAEGRATHAALDAIQQLGSRATAGGCGPGWGRSDELTAIGT